jgi:hypothetical protein
LLFPQENHTFGISGINLCHLCHFSKYLQSLKACTPFLFSVAPGAPQISTQPASNLREGNVAILNCVSDGGNPTPTIQWYRKGIAVQSTTKVGVTTTGILQRTLTYDDHDAVYSCKVFNVVNENKPLEVQKKLDVQCK